MPVTFFSRRDPFASYKARTAFIPVVFVVWILGAGIGVHALLGYAYTQGTPAKPPSKWPANSRIPRNERFKLIVFAHPECPCSRATLRELAIIVGHFRKQLDVNVCFYSPRSMREDWRTSDLWSDASSIPGVTTFEDIDGRESRKFGAATSGQALLYDAPGRLLFEGGITASRGHSGSNDGSEAVVDILQGRTPKVRNAPVFGCSILGPTG